MALGKTLILGDSYSTFEGFIPNGYNTWYSECKKDCNDVEKVNQTWWYQLFDGKDNILLRNDSYSGATICNTVRPEHTVDVSFVNRFDTLIKKGFFRENKVDTIFIFGGTNDSWIGCPIGENQFDNFTEDDLLKVLPACGYLAKRMFESAPNVRICWLINTQLEQKIAYGIITNAEHFHQGYIRFTDIDKLSGHPSIKGMQQIAEQIKAYFAL